MADKKIVWSYRAKIELRDVLEYYNHRNKSTKYSLKLLKQIEDLLNTLSKNEFIGRLASNKVTRVMPMKAYLVFYEVSQHQIEILSFWDNRQNDTKKIVK